MPTLTKREEEVAQEDLVMFINACYSCSGQREFYDDANGQRVSIDFLHDYILGNYRLLYARTLSVGINHFNQAQVILKLLATGKNTIPEHRQEEGALIATALNSLPPQRAWGVLQGLQEKRINNRRARAIAREFIASRRDIIFDAVKYRPKVKSIISHSHLNPGGELSNFLFAFKQQKSFSNSLFEQFRQAHYSKEAVYKLPFTIAEGLAVKHKIKREEFLSKIQSQMTPGEKLRFQKSGDRSDVDINLDFGNLPITKLALYILSLPLETRKKERYILNQALEKAAYKTLKKAPLKLGRVAAVLDCSYSSSGSNEKRRRPLAVALAAHYLLKTAAKDYRAFWTIPVADPILVYPNGQTNLATPLLAALGTGVETVVIISDGFENDPPNGAAEVLRVYRTKLEKYRKTTIAHCNPVYTAETFSLRTISPYIPTVGLREAEDLPTMLGFARMAEGSATLAELESYLDIRVKDFIQNLR
jgi:hypothetical protein